MTRIECRCRAVVASNCADNTSSNFRYHAFRYICHDTGRRSACLAGCYIVGNILAKDSGYYPTA
jgi:hypothetical protein